MPVVPVSPYFNYDLNGANRYGFAPSQYSLGGQFSLAPTQQYINPYQAAQQQTNSASGPNLLDVASNVNKLNNSGTGILGNVTSSINQFGTGLGFAPVASSTGLVYGGVGPAALPWAQPGMLAPTSMAGEAGVMSSAGSLGTTATLSSTLGAAGIGAFAGNFLGKIGGNSTGGSIGGALGAAVGNMILPGIGGIIGGALGGVAGGFFGNKSKPTQSDEYRALLNADGSYKGVYSGGKNAGAYAGYGEATTRRISDMMQRASKELGIQFKNDTLVGGGISTRHGGSHIAYGVNNTDKQAFYDAKDDASTNAAMKEVLLFAAQNSGVQDLNKVGTWFDSTTSGKTNNNAYSVPFKSKENFDSFMTKFKTQDTVNASTNATPAQ